MPVSMRPEALHDPAVEPVEEPADMSALVVLAPATKDRVDLLDKLGRGHRRFATRELTNLIFEVSDRSLSRDGIQRSRFGATFDLRIPIALKRTCSIRGSRLRCSRCRCIRLRPLEPERLSQRFIRAFHLQKLVRSWVVEARIPGWALGVVVHPQRSQRRSACDDRSQQ